MDNNTIARIIVSAVNSSAKAGDPMSCFMALSSNMRGLAEILNDNKESEISTLLKEISSKLDK